MAARPLRVRSRRSTSHGCSWLWTKNAPCQPPAGSVSTSSSHGPPTRSATQLSPGAYSVHPVMLMGLLVAHAHHTTGRDRPVLSPETRRPEHRRLGVRAVRVETLGKWVARPSKDRHVNPTPAPHVPTGARGSVVTAP